MESLTGGNENLKKWCDQDFFFSFLKVIKLVIFKKFIRSLKITQLRYFKFVSTDERRIY